MLLKDLYRNLDVLVNEDGTDDYFGIDDFNRILPSEQVSFILDVMDEEKNNPPDKRHMTDMLLAATTQAASADTYFWEVPEDLLRVEDIVYIPASGTKQPVEFIQSREVIKRTNDILSPPPEENYFAYIEIGDTLHDLPYYDVGRWIRCFPQFTTGTWGLFYIREPSDPFLDYYINTNDEKVFLDYQDSLTAITTGTYRDGTDMNSVTGTCTTNELDIPVGYHTRFMERLIERLGIKDRDELALQYGAAKDLQEGQNN